MEVFKYPYYACLAVVGLLMRVNLMTAICLGIIAAGVAYFIPFAATFWFLVAFVVLALTALSYRDDGIGATGTIYALPVLGIMAAAMLLTDFIQFLAYLDARS